jgi:hypothetical protein
MGERLIANPDDLPVLQRLEGGLILTSSLPFQVNLWKLQNICYELLETTYPEFKAKAERGEEKAREWVDAFTALSRKLWVRVG